MLNCFILRHAPVYEELISEMQIYLNNPVFTKAMENIKTYFTNETGPGCVMVEKENGPDEYIENLLRDIYRRFIKVLNLQNK